MKIRRIFAPDAREAMRKVREEQGPDAVILSNRRVRGGVELIAALDYDESLLSTALRRPAPTTSPALPEVPTVAVGTTSVAPAAPPSDIVWSQEPSLAEMQEEIKSLRGLLEGPLAQLNWGEGGQRQALRAALLQRLAGLGLSPQLSAALAEPALASGDLDRAWVQSLGLLAQKLRVTDDDILTQGGVVALVGPTGVGKTTTVAKLAARFALRYGQRQVALVTTDSYRIGGHEQLRTYGRILGLPVSVAPDADELYTVLQQLSQRKLVLVDTAGMSQRDLRLSEEFAALQGLAPLVKTYLVLSATAQRSVLEEVVRGFHPVHLAGCVLTKVDEAAALGDALSVLVAHQLPLAYVGDGQRVPEDLHPARAATLVSRAVSIAQRVEQQQDTGAVFDHGRAVANAQL